MTKDEYQKLAMRTAPEDEKNIKAHWRMKETVPLIHSILGLADEVGELAKQLKAHLFYGEKIDLINIIEESGDASWYMNLGLNYIGSSFDEVMTANIAKLAERYPEKFSEYHAKQRGLDKERYELSRACVSQREKGLPEGEAVKDAIDAGFDAARAVKAYEKIDGITNKDMMIEARISDLERRLKDLEMKTNLPELYGPVPSPK